MRKSTFAPLPGLGGEVGALFLLVPGCGVKQAVGPRDDFDRMALSPIQTHSSNVRIVNDEADIDIEDTDALITFREELPIGVRTADCVPILMYAADIRAVAAVHAGWRGSVDGIVDRTLDALEERGADPENIRVTFGPSISKEHYQVDADLARRFVEEGFEACVSYPDGPTAQPHLDLQGVNIGRLIRRGVRMENIRPCELCTFASADSDGNPILPSYRRCRSSDRILTSVMILDPSKISRPR